MLLCWRGCLSGQTAYAYACGQACAMTRVSCACVRRLCHALQPVEELAKETARIEQDLLSDAKDIQDIPARVKAMGHGEAEREAARLKEAMLRETAHVDAKKMAMSVDLSGADAGKHLSGADAGKGGAAKDGKAEAFDRLGSGEKFAQEFVEDVFTSALDAADSGLASDGDAAGTREGGDSAPAEDVGGEGAERDAAEEAFEEDFEEEEEEVAADVEAVKHEGAVSSSSRPDELGEEEEARRQAAAIKIQARARGGAVRGRKGSGPPPVSQDGAEQDAAHRSQSTAGEEVAEAEDLDARQIAGSEGLGDGAPVRAEGTEAEEARRQAAATKIQARARGAAVRKGGQSSTTEAELEDRSGESGEPMDGSGGGAGEGAGAEGAGAEGGITDPPAPAGVDEGGGQVKDGPGTEDAVPDVAPAVQEEGEGEQGAGVDETVADGADGALAAGEEGEPAKAGADTQADTEQQHAAATAIQRRARGMAARKEVGAKRGAGDDADASEVADTTYGEDDEKPPTPPLPSTAAPGPAAAEAAQGEGATEIAEESVPETVVDEGGGDEGGQDVEGTEDAGGAGAEGSQAVPAGDVAAQNAAATKIQSRARGMHARKKRAAQHAGTPTAAGGGEEAAAVATPGASEAQGDAEESDGDLDMSGGADDLLP